VHFYEPFNFTHQGASWVGRENKVGVQWRSSPAEQADVLKYLTTAQQWAKQNNRPLFIGEYGAYEAADATSRVQWTHFVTQQALRCGLPVAYWEFCSSFGIYDPKKEEWRKELLQSVIEE